MKNIRSFLHGLIICGVAMAMVSTVSAQSVVQGKAKVIRLKGSARFTTGNNTWQPLRAGDVLRPGTVIQTGLEKGSFVDLALGDGSGAVASSMGGSGVSTSSDLMSVVNHPQPKAQQNFVRLWENTVLGIDKLTAMDTGADTVTETQLDLKAGHIFGNVKKMSASSKYEVKLPNGVAGIRGTIYDITADGVIKVSSGSVVFAYVGADGTVVTQVVNGAQKFDARTGQISPLTPGEVRTMEEIAASGRGGSKGFITTGFAVDHTVYRTSSPHHGNDDDQGDDNNDQGGNG